MRDTARRAVLAGACWIATACATSSPEYFARMEERGRSLINQQRWEEALRVSQKTLAKCDRTDWCRKDPRYQGLLHTATGQAQEHLGRRDLAMEHYRTAFYAYPLFFTENYFRLLKESGMYRQLRREIDVKLASNESISRSEAAFWLPSESLGCRGRSVAGSYGWRLRAGKAAGGARVSGRVLVSQTGCAVAADFASANEEAVSGPLRLRADIESGAAALLFGLPCAGTDRGRLILEKNGLVFIADATAAMPGCFQGPYTIEFVKD